MYPSDYGLLVTGFAQNDNWKRIEVIHIWSIIKNISLEKKGTSIQAVSETNMWKESLFNFLAHNDFWASFYDMKRFTVSLVCNNLSF